MSAEPDPLSRALDALRQELGADRILTGASAAREIRQRSLNPDECAALRAVVRPRNTAECRTAIESLAAVGCQPDVVAGLTTFWEPHPSEPSLAIDALALDQPARIDARERVGYFGAGVTVRDADRLARAQGLCLLAYPDSDGSQSLGSMAAVACTTGLGMGRVEPIEQFCGLTVVTRHAAVIHTGCAWRRGRGGAVHGAPDPMSLFLGSQGRFGIITEVVVKLWPAPFLASRAWQEPWSSAAEIAAAVRRARESLDLGCVDSMRLESVGAGRASMGSVEWFVRCWAADSASADRRCAEVALDLQAREPRCWVECERARRGEMPDYDGRFSVPPGQHRERTGRDGFLGIEVTVNWGEQLDAALPLFLGLLESLAKLAPGHRRIGIYPGAHVVSIGVQAMLAGGEAAAADVRAAMATLVEPLTALGVVPYRSGRLWESNGARREFDDAAWAAVRRAIAPECER